MGCETKASRPPGKATTATEPQPAWFADVTAELGVNFIHDPKPINGEYFMPQINASGEALFDCGNDGRLDIYLLQGGGPQSTSTNVLFRPMPDGTFQNVSQESVLDVNGYNTYEATS